ncbi:MAG TPA: TIGR00730 family Rossman fold protein [Woeseiaceae bacterium]|nr:TIGR00730 family Rossman fold protein [Woeseiaceae bacterium]
MADRLKALCVYCGSNVGIRDVYAAAADDLGRVLAEKGIGLVYGGAAKGLMGRLADAVLAAGGEVQGVIPHALMDKEIAHPELTKLHVVDTMHARKALMAELSDGFIGLPGGFGTLEETIEIVTWAQLKIHDKPCGLLNVQGFFTHLLAYLDHAETEGFLKTEHRRMLVVEEQPAALIERFEGYRAPTVEKWM